RVIKDDIEGIERTRFGHHIEITRLVLIFEVGRRRDDLAVQRLDASDGLYRARRAHAMTDHALEARHRNAAASEEIIDHLRFDHVICRGTGTVRADMVHLIEAEPASHDGEAHGFFTSLSFRMGTRDVVSVAGESEGTHLRKRTPTAPNKRLFRLEDEDSGTFTDEDPIALPIKGADLLLGHGAQPRETCVLQLFNDLARARNHDIGPASADLASGDSNRVIASRTGGGERLNGSTRTKRTSKLSWEVPRAITRCELL